MQESNAEKIRRQLMALGGKAIHNASSDTQSFEVLLLPGDEVVILVRFIRDGVESERFGLFAPIDPEKFVQQRMEKAFRA